MAAVTGAMAQATLYGTIEQTYNKSTTTVDGVVISSKKSLGAYQMGQSFIGVKGSEELNNGLKAAYLYEFGVQSETSATPTNRQSFVGLSGGFGAIRLGKQYSQGFNNAIAADPGGATGATGALYLAPMTGYNGTEAPLRQDKALQFDLPSFVPGLNITLTKVWGGNNTAATSDDYTQETNGVNTGDGTGYALTYTSGPLYVGFTSDSVTNTGINFGTNDDAVAAIGGTSAAASASAFELTAGSATQKNKLTTATATYDLGMAKVGYSQTKMAVGAESLSTSMVSVSVPLGQTTVFYSSSNGDIVSTSGDYAIGNASLKGTQYGANYALSKRTVAYIHGGRLTADLTTLDAVKKVNNYGIGIHHSFYSPRWPSCQLKDKEPKTRCSQGSGFFLGCVC